jgi:hypothetical protein
MVRAIDRELNGSRLTARRPATIKRREDDINTVALAVTLWRHSEIVCGYAVMLVADPSPLKPHNKNHPSDFFQSVCRGFAESAS